MGETTRVRVAAGIGTVLGAALTIAVAVPWASRAAAQGSFLAAGTGAPDLAGPIDRVAEAIKFGSERDDGFTYLLSADGATLWVIKDSTQWATVW